MITVEQLKAIVPACANPEGWIDSLNAAMAQFGIDKDADFVAAFLAQVAVESGDLNRLDENLNYTAERLMAVWPKRFPSLVVAAPYARNPHGLANFVYANRLGNGDAASGDGWSYRGRGLIQITGKNNYTALSQALKDPSVAACPNVLCTKKYAALSAAWFWIQNPKIDELADNTPNDDQESDFVSITRLVNGGTTGLQQRRIYWQRAKTALGA